jgi:hypothetical protein
MKCRFFFVSLLLFLDNSPRWFWRFQIFHFHEQQRACNKKLVFNILYCLTGQSNYCYIIEPRYFVTSFLYLSHFMNRFLVFLDRLLYYLIHPWCCGTLLVHWRTLLLQEESYCTTPKLWYCCVRGSYWDPIAALGTLLLHWGPYTSALKTLLLF